MKRLLLIPILLLATVSFSQIVDQFTYTTAANANGWSTHSGTGGQVVPLTTASDDGSSLAYPGFAASTGNRITLTAGNGEDINKAITGISGTGYYSFLMKVTNTTGLTATGDYFTGFGKTAGTNVTVFSPRVFIKTGSTAGTFNLGIQNYTGGSPTQTYTGDYPVGTTVLVVVKLNTTTSPYTANLFVNPVPGAVEPAPTVSNNSGTTTDFTTFASVFFRQAGNVTSGTGNVEIDEIRAGSTWASVTPAGAVSCNTTNTISVSACETYTVPSNDETYNTSGTYHDTIPNAGGCDSILTINLTIKHNTTSAISPVACGSYTVPSTDETYMTSGTYHDTIPNAAGCDSIITINLTITGSIMYYADMDHDGFGDPDNSQPGCAPITDYVTNDDDCDDTDPAITLGTAYYPDTDGDGLGDNSATAVISCDPVTDHVTNNTDCNDTDPAVGAAQTYYQDLDGDGYGNPAVSQTTCTAPGNYVTDNTDCNDNAATIHPGATEIPNNGIDEDCNGSDLNTFGSTLGMYQFTGNDCLAPATNALEVTTQPANATFSAYGETGDSLQCISAAGVFNYKGFNTTTAVDSAQYFNFSITPANCYGLDLNRVIFKHKTSATGLTPTVHLRSSLDNFATDIATKQLPNSTLKTDTIDLGAAFDNITSVIEFRWYITEIGQTGSTYRHDDVTVIGNINALTPQTYYADTDGDGFGDPAVSQPACTAPVGYVLDNTDCDDTNEDAHPGAIWYHDTDGDGFGDSNDAGTSSCMPVPGSAANNDDCDDSDEDINPAAAEVCDGVDNNCDGDIDEGLTMVTYYEDADNDTYGDPNSSVMDCTQPTGYVTNNDDCDDTNAAAYPGATDNTGNGVDENCDGVDGVLGIEESILAHLNVYPNPGTSSVVLNMNNGWNGFQVTFAGVDGKEVALIAVQKSANELEFNTESLVSGVYFIRLTSASGTALVRWVKN